MIFCGFPIPVCFSIELWVPLTVIDMCKIRPETRFCSGHLGPSWTIPNREEHPSRSLKPPANWTIRMVEKGWRNFDCLRIKKESPTSKYVQIYSKRSMSTSILNFDLWKCGCLGITIEDERLFCADRFANFTCPVQGIMVLSPGACHDCVGINVDLVVSVSTPSWICIYYLLLCIYIYFMYNTNICAYESQVRDNDNLDRYGTNIFN